MGAASVLMGNGSSDTGIAPLWVIPLTTRASWASLPRQEPSLLLSPLPASSCPLPPPPCSLLPKTEVEHAKLSLHHSALLKQMGQGSSLWARSLGGGRAESGFSCPSPVLLYPGWCSEAFGFPLVVMLSLR